MIGIIAQTMVGQNPKRVNYKTIGSTTLYMDVYSPSNVEVNKTNPAIVFFFGGGWTSRNFDQFKPHAEYFSQRGLVCFVVDYRTKNVNGTTPFEALKDAKSAMRYIRSHAEDFGINPDSIVASGGSAGGHLAAACAFVEKYNETSDDLSVSCKPQALVLFNPVIDNGPEGYGYSTIKEAYVDFSPLHNVSAPAPPNLFMIGTSDDLIPLATVVKYRNAIQNAGARCDVILFQGQEHGFFNYNNTDNYKKTVFDADTFLISLGYLKGEPNIYVKSNEVKAVSSEILLYPNPNQGTVTVELPENISDRAFMYELFSMKGQSLLKGNSTFPSELDVYDLATGTYLIFVHGPEQIYSSSLLKMQN